ncbi:MAG: metal-sensitive transcriptional regulator [Candidatus Binatia bacterium]
MIDRTTKAKVGARLKRIGGQIAGIDRMVEGDAYCVDILVQIAAVQAALAQVGKVVLGRHIETCVSEAIRGGSATDRRAKIDELMDVFTRYGRIGG